MGAILRLVIPAYPSEPLLGGREIVGGCVAIALEDVRGRMILRRDHLAERGCLLPPDPAVPPASTSGWMKRDRIQFKMNRHQEYLRLAAAVVEVEDAILRGEDLEVAAALFRDGCTEIERWSGFPILNRLFVWAECRACGRRYTPEECGQSDWSRVADPRAGIGGSCLACPAGHVIFSKQTWIA